MHEARIGTRQHGRHPLLRLPSRKHDKVAYAHTSFFTTEVAEELAEVLVADAPRGIGHVYMVSGGSEAMEAALKLARQYFVEAGEPEAFFTQPRHERTRLFLSQILR